MLPWGLKGCFWPLKLDQTQVFQRMAVVPVSSFQRVLELWPHSEPGTHWDFSRPSISLMPPALRACSWAPGKPFCCVTLHESLYCCKHFCFLICRSKSQGRLWKQPDSWGYRHIFFLCTQKIAHGYVWMLRPCQLMCWNLTPKVKVLSGGASGRWLSYESRDFMNGTSALIKEPWEPSLALFTTQGHSENHAIPEDGSSPDPASASAMTLGF